jgi:hypothetical protein
MEHKNILVNIGKQKIAKMTLDALVAHITADFANRIALPKHLSDRIPWLMGKESIQAWLLLVTPGRFRLLSDDQVKSDPQLEPVRSLIVDGKSAVAAEPTCSEEPTDAAIVARLVPALIAAPGPGWRISFPKAFELFVPREGNAKAFSIIFSLEGYLEIWCTDVLRRALSSHLFSLGG